MPNFLKSRRSKANLSTSTAASDAFKSANSTPPRTAHSAKSSISTGNRPPVPPRSDARPAPLGSSNFAENSDPFDALLASRSKPPTPTSARSPQSRPRSLSSSASSHPRDSLWPPVSSVTSPWTSPPTSWPSASLSAREQCVRSTALLVKILGFIDYGSDREAIRKQRQSLLWVALSSKSVSATALRVLWSRLDNILPLLYLLPSFGIRGGKYGLYGASPPHEWQKFDQHASYVKAIHYEDIPSTIQVDSAVFVRLILRNANSSVLPYLERFVCKSSVRPSDSEIMVYLQSPLRVLELGVFVPGTLFSSETGKMTATREAIVSSLSTNPGRISHLVLVDQPFSLLSEGIPLHNLTSLEFRAMFGVMDVNLLRHIGSLPHLRSLTADSGFFTGLNLSNIGTRLTGTLRPPVNGGGPPQRPASSHGTLFSHLTYLELERHPSLPLSTIALFLQLIGSQRLRTLILSVRPARKAARAGAKDGSDPHDLAADPLFSIAARWSRTLRHLTLEIDHNHSTIYNFLRHLPALRTLRLTGFLHVPADADIFSIFEGLQALDVLELKLRDGADPPGHMPLDMQGLVRLVRTCPTLRVVDVGLRVPAHAPPSSTWPISQALRAVRVHYADQTPNTVWLARYLDRLFPRLGSVRFVGAGGDGDEAERAAWAQVQELVFAFQDVRRGE
ncbi:hypothetical protein R3P38DRAFT_2552843 [Favolaschia claudopus]|uniref:Proteophosphoglycan ppg4 n=1 Tax=Favolaschia claudopus TaxID=2862362 RepID=A0AAW0AGB6_9AGAR